MTDALLAPVFAAARETLTLMLHLDAVDVTTGTAPVDRLGALVDTS